MEKKMNNKGFSLVELIIVIAIMAVLIGILAPTYLKYVERSRISADGTTIDEFVNAMQIVASDPAVTLDSTKTYSVTSPANSGTVTISADLQTLLADVVDTTKTYTLKSTSFKDANISVALTYDATAKVWKVAQTGVPSVE